MRLIWLVRLWIMLSLMLLIFSCNSVRSKSYTLSGKILDIENVGIEGATVLLYKQQQIKAGILEVKTEFPNIGADLDMYDTFDHRTAKPMVVVSSNALGEFSLNKIGKGTYHLVAYKEGYGFKYQKEIKINQNENNNNVILSDILSLPAAIDGEATMLSDRVYLLSGDFTLLPGSTLNVGSGVTLLVPPHHKLNIHGNWVMEDTSSITIMSSDKLYSHSHGEADIEDFDSMVFLSQTSKHIHSIKMKNNELGMKFQDCNDFHLSNVFLDSAQSISVGSSPGFKLSYATISQGKDTVRGAVGVEFSNNIEVKRCHFFENEIGLRIGFSTGVNVSNNYFHLNTKYDMGFDYGSVGTVEYNTFRDSPQAIDNYRGRMYINYNDIQAAIGIYAYRVYAWISANHNNLQCTRYGIKSQCMYHNSDTVHLDCTQNYWYTTNVDEIKKLIFDKDNERETDPNYHILVSKVDFLPISNRPLVAGVSN